MKIPFSLQSILVLCEGNHCRSPIAQCLFQAEFGPSIRVESAGLGAQDGWAPHPEAIWFMAEFGIDISGFRSRQVTPGMAMAAELILVMDAKQKTQCEAMEPNTRGRIYLLGHWLPPGQREIADPFRNSHESFLHAFNLIRQSVLAWTSHLAPAQGIGRIKAGN